MASPFFLSVTTILAALIRSVLLLSLVMGLVGCPDGGGDPPLPPSTFKSWVQVLVVDSAFDPVDVEYVITLDPTGISNSGSHGIRVVDHLLEYTNALVIGYLPFYTIGDRHNFIDLDAGVRWAADNGVQVVNLSWAGCCFNDQHEAAAQYAFERGVTVVWGAGNDSQELTQPNSPYILVIGALPDWSNYGISVDAYLGEVGGTSLSAAQASGIIAELYEELNPTMNATGAALIRDTFLARY